MELFLALLTGVLLGLFLVHVSHVIRHNACQRAGKLLYRARLRCFPRWLMHLSAMFVVITVVNICIIFLVIGNDLLYGTISIGIMMISYSSMFVVMPVVCFWRPRILEFWENGCFLPGTPSLLGWKKIRYFDWNDSRDVLSMTGRYHFRCVAFKLYAKDYEAVNKALFPHVELRDGHGNVLNSEPEYPRERSMAGSTSKFRFQFGLKTILFLMVVAASGSAWLGVHLRAEWHNKRLLQQLDTFQPVVDYRGNRVYGLDFSQSTTKPSDDDLRHVAEFQHLTRLDLSGCPITDEGLTHLKKLKRLERLDISNTKVTDAGLVHLANIKSLRYLYARSYSLPHNMFSEDALKKFQKMMPNVEDITY